MLFKKDGNKPQNNEIISPSPPHSKAPTITDSSSEKGDTMAEDPKQSQSDIVYPSGLKLALLMMSIFTSMFLVSLVSIPSLRTHKKRNKTNRPDSKDRLIISTAIPQITNAFNSAGDIGWYGTAYMLTSCAFQLVFGKIYKVFSIKGTFLTSILLFEVGSALCGAAPNSIAFILGRAIAGLGSGGVLSGMVCFPSFPGTMLSI
jgi:MFS family permease